MKILWFTWKDKKNPLAGGAEIMNEELAKRLVEDGNEVILLVGGFRGAQNEEIVEGYKIIRVGNFYTVFIFACIHYLKHLRSWPDLIIEEINTIPFFTQFYHQHVNSLTRKPIKRILFAYMLCRQIWFYQFPFPLSLIGYLLEPLYLWVLKNNKLLTESESTKNDIIRFGFKKQEITVIPPGTDIEPITSPSSIEKYKDFTVLSLGALRAMKQTTDQIKAFERAKKVIPELKMKIAGDCTSIYGLRVLKTIKNSPYSKDIEYLGRIDQNRKKLLMQKSHVITVTSIKEGWGLIVTEAASQGTPAIVYNVDGLRDSVKDKKTGIITKKNEPNCLAEEIIKLYNDKNLYKTLQKNAWDWSKELNYDNSYKVFKKILYNEINPKCQINTKSKNINTFNNFEN